MNFSKKLSSDNLRTITSILVLLFACITFLAISTPVHAQYRLPGDDITNSLSAMGTVMKLADTLVFKIFSRFLAGLAILAAAWNLKEQRIGICVMCTFAAVALGLTPTFVKNIFDVGGGTIFSMINQGVQYYA